MSGDSCSSGSLLGVNSPSGRGNNNCLNCHHHHPSQDHQHKEDSNNSSKSSSPTSCVVSAARHKPSPPSRLTTLITITSSSTTAENNRTSLSPIPISTSPTSGNNRNMIQCIESPSSETPSCKTISAAPLTNSPPIPGQGKNPIKILLDHWAEYVAQDGRRFYYNSVTHESSWKPPRRRPSFSINSRLRKEDDEYQDPTDLDGNGPRVDPTPSNFRKSRQHFCSSSTLDDDEDSPESDEPTQPYQEDDEGRERTIGKLKHRLRVEKENILDVDDDDYDGGKQHHHHHSDKRTSTPTMTTKLNQASHSEDNLTEDSLILPQIKLPAGSKKGSLPSCRPHPRPRKAVIGIKNVFNNHPPKLPNGWSRHVDEGTGEIYFLSKMTQDKVVSSTGTTISSAGVKDEQVYRRNNNKNNMGQNDKSFRPRTKNTPSDSPSPTSSSSSPITTTAIPVPIPPSRLPLHRAHQQQQQQQPRPHHPTNVQRLQQHPPPPVTRNGLSRWNMKAKSMAQLPTSSESASSYSQPSSPVTSSIPAFIVKEQKKKLQRQLSATAFTRRGSGSAGSRVYPAQFNGTSSHPLHPNSLFNRFSPPSQADQDVQPTSIDLNLIPPKPPATVDQLKATKLGKIRDRLRQFLRRRPTLDTLREKGIFKDEPVFGCTLSNLCAREKSCVPKFVKSCIEAIEKRDLSSDGIYRVCGNLSHVQKIRFQVNQDNYSGLWAEEDVHVLTGLLKMFFREMKDPLLPCRLFEPLISAVTLKDKKSKLNQVSKLVHELPPCHLETLITLLLHLRRVKELSDENRMHIQNLAIVFGPTLMWKEAEKQSLPPSSSSKSSTVKTPSSKSSPERNQSKKKLNNNNSFAADMIMNMKTNHLIEFLLVEYDNIFSHGHHGKSSRDTIGSRR